MNGFALLSVNLYIRKFRSFVYVSNTVVHVKVSYRNSKIMSMPTKSYIYNQTKPTVISAYPQKRLSDVDNYIDKRIYLNKPL